MVGHRVKNQETFNSEYICSSCSCLLRDPVQIINCGHRLCQSCIDEQKGDVIICSTCYEKSPRERVKPDRGFRNDMWRLSVICFLCDWTGVLKSYQDHLNSNHANPTCGYCGEYFPTVNELNRHQLYVCDKMSVSCPLKQLGCENMILRANLSEHYRSKQHQRVVMNAALHLKSSNHSVMTTDSPYTTDDTTAQLQEIDETMNILRDGTAALDEDRQRLTTVSVGQQHALDALTKDFSKLKISMQEQSAVVDGLKVSQDILHQDVELATQKANDIQTRSWDGALLWKITDVQGKIAAAQSDRQTSIYSPPFYTSPTGYKLCLRLYFDGDGNARRTHMSLFIVLMRGEYDPILKFPFDFKVIFCLFDQTKQQKHIIDAFKPDTRSNSFQRPRSEMNVASGLPQFASLKLLHEENNPYIRDDAMFIKALIDFDDMPTAILSYVFNLNPAFTKPIQQGMIRLESEKRKQQSSSTSVSNAETK